MSPLTSEIHKLLLALPEDEREQIAQAAGVRPEADYLSGRIRRGPLAEIPDRWADVAGFVAGGLIWLRHRGCDLEREFTRALRRTVGSSLGDRVWARVRARRAKIGG